MIKKKKFHFNDHDYQVETRVTKRGTVWGMSNTPGFYFCRQFSTEEIARREVERFLKRHPAKTKFQKPYQKPYIV